MMAKFRTSYMDKALFELPQVIEDCRQALRGADFDTLVGTGFSGGAVVPALAMSIGKQFVLVRKENDGSHHGGGRLMGELGDRWIFVDDFVSSGQTRRYVITKIANAAAGCTVMVGQCMYGNQTEARFDSFQEDWVPEGVQLEGEVRRSGCTCWACVGMRKGAEPVGPIRRVVTEPNFTSPMVIEEGVWE